MKFDPAYGTHLSVLIPLIWETKGDVIEMGIGIGSTPVLHELCRGRKLVSYENDSSICESFSKFSTGDHSIRFVQEWESTEIERPWSVALLDHRPARQRRRDLMRLKKWADYIVIHDTEDEIERFYRLKGCIEQFKYSRSIDLIPQTTVVSDRFPL